MKNIITIALILILPALIYSLISKGGSDLSALAKDNNLPTLMTFSSTMCMDCQKMKGIIKEVEGEYSGKVNFVAVNATEKDKKVKELVKKYSVVLVPTMIFLDSENKEEKRIEGYIPKEELVSELEELING